MRDKPKAKPAVPGVVIIDTKPTRRQQRRAAKSIGKVAADLECDILKHHGIEVNTLLTIPPFSAGSLRPIFRLFGGTIKSDKTIASITPRGFEFMCTQRNPQTGRRMWAERKLNGNWNVRKLNPPGYRSTASNVRWIFRDATYEKAKSALVTFSRVTAANIVEDVAYDKPITGRVFSGFGKYKP
jgi:hypothetical protein